MNSTHLYTHSYVKIIQAYHITIQYSVLTISSCRFSQVILVTTKQVSFESVDVLLVTVHKKTQIMPRLSPELRERAIGMLGANIGVTEISRRLGCGRVAIYRLQRRFQQTGSTRDRPLAGRPRATTRADDRAIRLRHLRDRFLPATSSTNLPQGRKG